MSGREGPGPGLFEVAAPGGAPAPPPRSIPAPRLAPDEVMPPATPDVWRLSGLGVVARPDYSPGRCSGDHGLCGVCTGSRCENAPEPEPDDTEHDEEEPAA